ncbi:hypothetical protein BGZ74_005223 [Mortierella antarctica]|nr:hypothetical protein BGZ74_005223 [Mortierella antarctica]
MHSHTPDGKPMTRVPSEASTITTIHSDDLEGKFPPYEELQTAQFDSLKSDKLPAKEYELIVHSWNKTDAPYPSDQSVHELFKAQVVNAPDAIALVHENRTMTYCQLNHHTNRLAHQLVAADVQYSNNVVMMLERSFELIVSQLAIVKVGAAYVPIDVKAPLDQQMYIASDSGAKLLITNESRKIPEQLDMTVLCFCADDENIAEDEAKWSKLKYLVSRGEQGLVEAYAKVLRHGTSVHVLNTYGPMEMTVIATMYKANSCIGQLDRVPIGRPISNTRLYVPDRHHKPVPVGAAGELYISGPGVATGYLNLPELTAERFLPDPFSRVPDACMYKSGDLVKHLPDGNLIFPGFHEMELSR